MSQLLSICIPTYNRARFLDECLFSIKEAIAFAKADDYVEVVVCDNASPDDTAAVVERYRPSLKNLVYHRNDETIFAEDNFYLVGQIATGKYIWLIGDDDKISKDAVQHAAEKMALQPDVIIANFSLHSQNFAREISPAKYTTNQTELADHNSVLIHFGTYLAFISGAIINKEIFYAADKADYNRYKVYGLSFFYTLCKCIINKKVVYVNQPIVECRTGNSGNYDWVKYMIIGYDEALKDLVSIGYSQSAADTVRNDFIKNEVVSYFLKLKADGEPLDYAFTELNARYDMSSFYGRLCKILRFVPGPLLTVAKKVKNKLIHS